MNVLIALLILFFIALISYAAALSPAFRRVSERYDSLAARRPRVPFWSGLVAVALITGLYAFIVFNRSLPMTEGWYTVFAKYILNGKLPYRDFELLFTPGYSYLIAGIVKLFGYDLIVLRTFGAILFVSIGVTLYLIFNRLFASWIAVVAACVSVFYLQSEAAQVFYDYIRVYDFINLLTLLFLILWIQTSIADRGARRRRATWFACICGLLTGCSILLRQSSGVIVAVFCAVLAGSSVALSKRKKPGMLMLVGYIGCALLPLLGLAVAMQAGGVLGSYLSMTGSDALASKGGMVPVLFGWIPRTLRDIATLWREILFMILALGGSVYLYWRREKREGLDGRKSSFESGGGIWFVLFSAASLFAILLMYKSQNLSTTLDGHFSTWFKTVPLFVIGVLVFFVTAAYVLTRRQRISQDKMGFYLSVIAVSGFYLATAYGSATSSGFSQGQSAIAIGLLFALLLHCSQHPKWKGITSLVLAVALCVSMASVAHKYEHPYSWWGLSEPNVWKATETADVPLLDHIRVSPERKRVVEGIYTNIVQNSTEDDAIFVFPHIPIFYAITDRYPDTRTLIQWFDVSSEKRVLDDIQTLEKNPPKVMVICEIPEATVKGHETLFRDGRHSAQREMMYFLYDLAADKHYERVGKYYLGAGYVVSVYALP